MAAPLPHRKLGQPSWRLKTRGVEVFVTRTAGMLAPATFALPGGRTVRPFAVAPWVGEKLDAGLPPLLHALRGDFFCAPFGGNGAAWRGEVWRGAARRGVACCGAVWCGAACSVVVCSGV